MTSTGTPSYPNKGHMRPPLHHGPISNIYKQNSRDLTHRVNDSDSTSIGELILLVGDIEVDALLPLLDGLDLHLRMVCTCSRTRCSPVRNCWPADGRASEVLSTASMERADLSGSKLVMVRCYACLAPPPSICETPKKKKGQAVRVLGRCRRLKRVGRGAQGGNNSAPCTALPCLAPPRPVRAQPGRAHTHTYLWNDTYTVQAKSLDTPCEVNVFSFVLHSHDCCASQFLADCIKTTYNGGKLSKCQLANIHCTEQVQSNQVKKIN